MQTNWNELEHKIYKSLLDENIQRRSLVLLVSGGADSMVMLSVMSRLASALKLELAVLHCHHGQSDDAIQWQFREQAKSLVENACRLLRVRFYVDTYTATCEGGSVTKKLQSEDDFRSFRKNAVEKLQAQIGFDFSFWAHNENDFIETQFLRLIRGAGAEALAQPMLFHRGKEIRPFLNVSRRSILEYAANFNIEFCEDPSNYSNAYLRNWMRNTWLPLLEEKQPGALHALSRSLVLLFESNEIDLPAEIWCKAKDEEPASRAISRAKYGQLTKTQQRQVLIQAIKFAGILNFSYNHVLEVMKQLDKTEKEHSFRVASIAWTVNSEMILFAPRV